MIPTGSQLLGGLFIDRIVEETMGDAAFVRRLLAVEAALALAQAELGVIPEPSAQAIRAAAQTFSPDMERLRQDTERAGVPVAGLVAQLRTALDEEAGRWLHYGATSQDIIDTARVLQLRDMLGDPVQRRLEAIVKRLEQLADEHRHTLMAGRTHSQQAVPITFGLKVAGWLAPLKRHQVRLEELEPRLFVVQLGGAAGTLAPLGEQGVAVMERLARGLDLGVPEIPWHSQRDRFAELAGWLSLVTGSLGKMAQDVILMAQSEVGEIAESADVDRGGSSTMPQKRNPIQSELIVAAARQNAALLSSMHQAQIQEHERGTHGWQVEWIAMPQMLSLTARALERTQWLTENMQPDVKRMAANVEASNGMMLAEAISFVLAEHMPRSEAKRMVREAALAAETSGQHLVDELRARVGSLDVDWYYLREEHNHLGAADAFIDRVLNSSK